MKKVIIEMVLKEGQKVKHLKYGEGTLIAFTQDNDGYAKWKAQWPNHREWHWVDETKRYRQYWLEER